MDLFPFDFGPIFWVIFVLPLLIFVLFFVVLIIRVIKSRGQVLIQTPSEGSTSTIVKEKEIIREIIKIRCPYCGTAYEEKLDKCPNCGAKKP